MSLDNFLHASAWKVLDHDAQHSSQIIFDIMQYPLHTKAACIVCEIFVTWFAHQAQLDNIELLR